VYNNYDKTPEEQDAAADPDQEGPSAGSSNDGAKAAALLRLKQGQGVRAEEVAPSQHFTRPPPRYTEATLVKVSE
jgi:DNA topoisomerase-1